MMNQNEQLTAEKIRTKYVPQKETALDALRALDARVKRPANVFAYVFGSISAIIMGCGMSLVMTDIGSFVGLTNALIPGIGIGVVGMLLALVNYPIWRGIMGARKKKYGGEILRLSEEIMNAKKDA